MKKELYIKLTPKASANRVVVLDDQTLKIYVTVVPEEGKANEAMISLLANHFNLPKSAFMLIRGQKSRQKVVVITQ